MGALSWGRVAGLSIIAGAFAAFGCMGAVALRAAYTITRGRRWYQLKQL